MNGMMFKVKDVDISSGGTMIGIMNVNDAKKLSLHHGDRIGIIKGNRHTQVILDIAESKEAIPEGSIGLFEEVLSNLKVRNGQNVRVVLESKPMSVHYIKEKFGGKRLDYKKIKTIIQDVVDGKLSDIELTYFIAASTIRPLDFNETVYLTRAIIETGESLNVRSRIVVDKHCTGGVAGNRTTMIVVPIVAAAGLKMPKTSSRAITSPAGTADTMEVLAPVTIPKKRMENIVKKANGCIVWGGAINLAPADDKLIKVRSPLRIDSEAQMLSSILAKKKSVNSTHVLIDIPVGRETKVTTKREGKRLAMEFVRIGKRLGMKIDYIITNGNEPIGNGMGPALEAKDVLKVLQRSDSRPLDLEKKSVMLAGRILEMAGKCRKGKGIDLAQQILDSGKAMEKMREIIKMQGGNPNIKSSDIKVGSFTYEYIANRNGSIANIRNNVISKVASFAGAPVDKEAGVYLYVHEGDLVKKGDNILTIHSKSKELLKFAKNLLFKAKCVEIR